MTHHGNFVRLIRSLKGLFKAPEEVTKKGPQVERGEGMEFSRRRCNDVGLGSPSESFAGGDFPARASGWERTSENPSPDSLSFPPFFNRSKTLY